MRILVAGADQVDAGKTTFSTGLLARVGGSGIKPRAGNDYWFDHDDVRTAARKGRLYGKDAARLAAASDDDARPEDRNPVHRLWRPHPGPAPGLIGTDDRQFVLDRVDGSYVVNADADLPAVVRKHLPVEDAVVVDSVEELNEITRRRHLPALHATGARIADAGTAVVESYGSVARPLRGTLPTGIDPEELYDRVAVVEPGRVRVYDGDRYVRACEVATTGRAEGQLEQYVGGVVEHLDPVATVDLPPLGADERTDPGSVADAYAPAYDALVDGV